MKNGRHAGGSASTASPPARTLGHVQEMEDDPGDETDELESSVIALGLAENTTSSWKTTSRTRSLNTKPVQRIPILSNDILRFCYLLGQIGGNRFRPCVSMVNCLEAVCRVGTTTSSDDLVTISVVGDRVVHVSDVHRRINMGQPLTEIQTRFTCFSSDHRCCAQALSTEGDLYAVATESHAQVFYASFPSSAGYNLIYEYRTRYEVKCMAWAAAVSSGSSRLHTLFLSGYNGTEILYLLQQPIPPAIQAPNSQSLVQPEIVYKFSLRGASCLEGTKGHICCCMAVSPSSHWIAIASLDGRLAIWRRVHLDANIGARHGASDSCPSLLEAPAVIVPSWEVYQSIDPTGAYSVNDRIASLSFSYQEDQLAVRWFSGVVQVFTFGQSQFAKSRARPPTNGWPQEYEDSSRWYLDWETSEGLFSKSPARNEPSYERDRVLQNANSGDSYLMAWHISRPWLFALGSFDIIALDAYSSGLPIFRCLLPRSPQSQSVPVRGMATVPGMHSLILLSSEGALYNIDLSLLPDSPGNSQSRATSIFKASGVSSGIHGQASGSRLILDLARRVIKISAASLPNQEILRYDLPDEKILPSNQIRGAFYGNGLVVVHSIHAVFVVALPTIHSRHRVSRALKPEWSVCLNLYSALQQVVLSPSHGVTESTQHEADRILWTVDSSSNVCLWNVSIQAEANPVGSLFPILCTYLNSFGLAEVQHFKLVSTTKRFLLPSCQPDSSALLLVSQAPREWHLVIMEYVRELDLQDGSASRLLILSSTLSGDALDPLWDNQSERRHRPCWFAKKLTKQDSGSGIQLTLEIDVFFQLSDSSNPNHPYSLSLSSGSGGTHVLHETMSDQVSYHVHMKGHASAIHIQSAVSILINSIP